MIMRETKVHFMLLFRVFFCLFCILAPLTALAQLDTIQRGSIDGYTVHGGVNPANLLMNKVAARRFENGAYAASSFHYTTYHKTAVLPTYFSDSLAALENHNLFLSESVSEVFYKNPSRHYEKLVASRTSGLQNPIFNLVFSRLQFQNLYASDYLEIFQVEYVSPLAVGSSKRYAFSILDTIFCPSDTFVTVSFCPKEGVAFKSLRGSLTVHLGDFAVRSFQAKPVDENVLVRVSVSQNYRQVENGLWFPDYLEATFPLPRIAQGGDTVESYAISAIHVKNIELNPPLKNSDFGIVDVEEVIVSERSSATILDEFRDSLLSDKELRTYAVLDSLSRKLKLQKRIDLLPSLMRGCIPIGPIDLSLTSIIDYSYNEGWRFGLGLYTNQRLARFVTLGGYFAYGLKDRAWKWGARTDWELWRKRSLILKIRIFDDIIESGATQLMSRDESGLLNGEYYRHWIITKYDKSRTFFAKLQMRPDRNFSISIAAGYSRNTTLYDYRFLPSEHSSLGSTYSYRNCYIRAGLRFAYNEKTYRTRDFSLYELSKFPTLQVLYEHGFQGVLGSDFNYNKINVRLHHLQRYKRLGYSELSIVGGWLDSSLPYSLLYVMPAGYEKLGFYGTEQFAVMRPNEFVSDAYVGIFLRHNFGKMWEGKFSPRIVLCHNMGFGWLHFAHDHRGVSMQSMEKGYFESGIMLDNLLAVKDILAMGVGVFFRYGPYMLEKTFDNFAFKVSLTVPMSE